MPSELFWLSLTAVLAASLWIPFVVGVNTTPGPYDEGDPFRVPPDPLKAVPWVARSYRAHQNLLEQLMPFAVIVLTGHQLGISNEITAWSAFLFFCLRLVHGVGMIAAWTRQRTRPLIFTAGWLVTIVYAWQVIVAG